jgi:hypothetical protein
MGIRSEPKAAEAASGAGGPALGANSRSAPEGAWRHLPAIEWLLVYVSYFALLFELHWVGSDAAERYDAITQLVTSHTLSTTRYSMVGPLFSVPIWYLGKLLRNDPRWACGYYNWVVFGVFLFVLRRLLTGVIEPTVIRRFLLLLVAGSMFAHHVQAYYGEVFTAGCIGAGALAVCARRGSWLGWIAIILGAANTPGVSLGAAALCLFFTVDRRQLRYLLPMLGVGAIIALESFGRRHGGTGYEGVREETTLMPYSGRPGFSYPIFLGLLGLTLSFGKGLLFFAPGVFAPVNDLLKGHDVMSKTYRAWLCFLVGIVLSYAKFCGWYGGAFWGPRYVMFASVPASFALALNLGARTSRVRVFVALTMLTMSIWICADGVLFRQQQLTKCTENQYALEHLCWFVPEFSVWIRPFIVHRPLVTIDFLFLTLYAIVYVVLAAPMVAFLARSVGPASWARLRPLLARRTWGI